MHISCKGFIAACLLGLLSMDAMAQGGVAAYNDTLFQPVTEALHQFLKPIAAATGVLRVIEADIDEHNKLITLTYSTTLAEYPFRNELVEAIYGLAAQFLPQAYQSYKLRILSGGKEISEWIPVFYKQAQRTERQPRRNSGNALPPPLKKSL
ncbi:MAG: hypothetical protein FWE99_02850, partial [Bacteroidales bacterium]|nr:hypothetical protein [Bacteroidales bacterium]